jgi:Secretion system C-terminal sorting domain
MKTLISILVLILLGGNAFAQASAISWQQCYGGTGGEYCQAIRATFDGGYVLAGVSFSNNGDVTGSHGNGDVWVVKISSTGVLEWEKCFGGSGYDGANDIQQMPDGSYVVVGQTLSSDGDVVGNHGGSDMWVIKISSSGVLQWQKCIGGSLDDVANAVSPTADGGCMVVGTTSSTDGDVAYNHGTADVLAVKLDGAGDIVWAKTYGGSSGDAGVSVQQKFDGGYVVGCNTSSDDGDVSGLHDAYGPYPDLWVVSLSDTGKIEWQKCLGGVWTESGGYCRQASDSGFIVVGNTNSTDGDVTGYISHPSPPFGNIEGWVVKLDAGGMVQWDRCILVSGDEVLNGVFQSGDGGYIMGGSSAWSTPVEGGPGDCNALFAKVSGTGVIEYVDTVGGSQTDQFNSVAPSAGGSGIAAGYSESQNGDVLGNMGQNYWVVQFGWGTGVQEISGTGCNISPNPAVGTVVVTANQPILDIAIQDMLGRTVVSGKGHSEKVELDVSGLMPGMYFVKVNNVETIKFVKQ